AELLESALEQRDAAYAPRIQDCHASPLTQPKLTTEKLPASFRRPHGNGRLRPPRVRFVPEPWRRRSGSTIDRARTTCTRNFQRLQRSGCCHETSPSGANGPYGDRTGALRGAADSQQTIPFVPRTPYQRTRDGLSRFRVAGALMKSAIATDASEPRMKAELFRYARLILTKGSGAGATLGLNILL